MTLSTADIRKDYDPSSEGKLTREPWALLIIEDYLEGGDIEAADFIDTIGGMFSLPSRSTQAVAEWRAPLIDAVSSAARRVESASEEASAEVLEQENGRVLEAFKRAERESRGR